MELSKVYPAYYQLCDMVCGTEDEAVEKSDVILPPCPTAFPGACRPVRPEGKPLSTWGRISACRAEDIYKEWYGGSTRIRPCMKRRCMACRNFSGKRSREKADCKSGLLYHGSAYGPGAGVKNGLIETAGIIADCKSGVTGAGRKPVQSNHYPELNESFTAYKVANHRHTPEIEQTLSRISGEAMKITFVPHLLPINRGILATCYARLKPGVTEEQIWDAYRTQYEERVFVRLLPKGQAAM